MKNHHHVPNVCKVTERTISPIPRTDTQKKIDKHTVQIQKKKYLRISELNITH